MSRCPCVAHATSPNMEEVGNVMHTGLRLALGSLSRAFAPTPKPRRADGLFCSRPFQWFEVSRGKEEGEVFVCCPSWLDQPIGNLARQSVAEVWNGKIAQDIRRSILDGSFEYCNASRCPHLQTLTDPVQRTEDVTDPELRSAIRDQLTVVPWGPRQVNCSYDRSCNLSCPSCRTGLIVESRRRDEILEIQRKLRDDALPEARFLYITGSGDPFGSPFFRKWLQTLRRADAPRLEVIHLHTNAVLWTERIWATLSEDIRPLIKHADISIDAASPETYAINRRGGEFATLLRNLEFIATLRRAGPLQWLGINMVVQANNFVEMPDFVRLGRRFGVDTVYFHQLVNWGTFSDEEFRRRAVHLRDHPRHREFLGVLGHEVLADPIVHMGNLTELRPSHARETSAGAPA
jgi:Radical SAM superfamily/Iron-sulfur cluster-binding domain